MKSNKLIPAAIASAVVGALVLTGCNEPSDGFKDQCKKAGGTIERENDYEALGMGPVGFGVPKPPPAKPAAPAPKAPAAPKPAPKAPKVEIPKTPKLPKNDAPKPNKPGVSKATPSVPSNGFAMGGKKKSKKHDDNDFLCVKNDTILFEEDE